VLLVTVNAGTSGSRAKGSLAVIGILSALDQLIQDRSHYRDSM
jgi:hypothetical protein